MFAPWATLATAHLVFLASTPFQLGCLHRAPTKVGPTWQGRFKILAYPLYAAVQLLVLVLLLTGHANPSSRHIAESALSLAASLGLLVLSPLAHRRLLSPSALITAYLLARLLCYSLWPTQHESSVASAQRLSTLVLLLLELQGKRGALLQPYARQPPEAVTSFLGNWLFVWVNPVLWKGYAKILSGPDIPVLDHHMSSKALRQAIRKAWDARERPENGATLPRVLLRCLLSPFLAPVVPRVFVILFRFAQPLLMSRAIRFVTSPPTDTDDETGYWIIIEASIVYTGIAISTSVYRHRLNRLRVMIRGALIGLIHVRTLETRGSNDDDGKAVTLMSNDIGNVQDSGEQFHETWGQFVEVVVGIVLLATRVGWLWPLPLVLIFLCSRMSRYVAKTLSPAQGRWNKATQQRISVINSMLGSIKNIKMLGLQQSIVNHVQDLRNQEMHAAAGVRWLSVAYNASANALGMFAPVFTIVTYAGVAYSRGEGLDTETAFTSIAILAMVTHPANMVMTMVPRAVVSYSSFARIQTYLLGERPVANSPDSKDSVDPVKPEDGVAISLEHVSITSPFNYKPVLQDVNVNVPLGSIVVLTGPVGSGKTTLARAILGEITPSSGSVHVASGNVAYCSQTPWLPNQSIRNAVCGPTFIEDWEEAWYQTSVQACSLESDFSDFPYGDSTVVGSKGMNISGGQRQRVALARAVYLRAKVVLLDDSFNALDGKTQSQVINNLLGEDGIFRKLGATVVWCTTDTRFFRLADEVIVLSEGTVREKGTWDQLRKDDPLLDGILHSHDRASDVDTQIPKEERIRLEAKGAGSNSGVNKADLARKNGDRSLYGHYCRAAGLGNITTLALCAMLYGFFITFPPYWLKWWTESSQSPSRTGFYMAGYLILLLLAYTITIYGIYVTVLHIAPTSGVTLHHRLLTAIMGAPLLYFSEINTGTILNRFSEDIQLVDKDLASSWSTLNIQVFKLLVQACLVFASQPLMTLSLPLSVVIVYMVQKVYLRTSRQLRILELESRAAVFSSLLETAQGATTIRAFGWEAPIGSENIMTLDASQRPFYLLLCLKRWLNVVLNLLIAGIAVGTIWLAVDVFRRSTTGGQIGVALNVILVSNVTLLTLVESWTNLEISLGAVARLKEVDTNTPSEEEEQQQQQQQPGGEVHSYQDEDILPPDWPSAGAIEFHNVSARFKPEKDSPLVLNSLSLTIQPGQTVVVCGRTGSGKSSLLLALLRLLDLTEGRVRIDNLDISRRGGGGVVVSKTTLRERAFITVAQEAFSLPQASLRFNLDPEGKAAPSVVVAALAKTGLWAHLCGGGGRRHPSRLAAAPAQKPAAGRDDDDEEEEEDEEVMPLLAADATHDHDKEEEEEDQKSHLVLLSTPLGELAALSAGQTQLLALARALVRKHVLTTTTTTTAAAAAAATTSTATATASRGDNIVTYTTFPSIIDNDHGSHGNGNNIIATSSCAAVATTTDAQHDDAARMTTKTTVTTTRKPILLLDEVTSSLDPATEARVYDVLEHDFVRHGHTVVMVTHKLDGVRGRLRKGRDRVLWMAGGEIVSESRFDEI